MIYIFQVPCDIVKGICGSGCKCAGNLCAEFPDACACVCSALRSAGELIRNLIGALNCFQGLLGGFLLMSCFVNGMVVWTAMRALPSKLVTECTETNSFGNMATLMKTDLAFAIMHVLFVLYLKLRISQQMQREQENAQAGNATITDNMAVHRSVVELLKRDFGVCFYVFFWAYVFYYNCVAIGLVEKCANKITADQEALARKPVQWLMAYAPLTLFYSCYLQAKLSCRAGRDHLTGGKSRVHAREGTVPYLPLAAEEAPMRAAAPQV